MKAQLDSSWLDDDWLASVGRIICKLMPVMSYTIASSLAINEKGFVEP